jgi:hypothetical protein
MADTLRGHAGALFQDTDVVSGFRAPIDPETAVLDRYVFMPHARSGIAAALDKDFGWEAPARATVELKVPVIDGRGPADAAMTVHVHGPADVLEIDPRQVIRTFPKADAHNAEVDDLAHIEFDRPDLPWMFTPAKPAAGRLVPWITLVVAEAGTLTWGEQRGATRRAAIRRDQLQPLRDAWAWAHAQVMGAKAADAGTPTLEQRLGGENAAHNLSRLVCPRRLRDNRHYIACVVPTFMAGRQAGLGITPVDALAPAWGTADDFDADDPDLPVEMPVYYAWSFATAAAGNFESLARKLKPAVAPPGVGRRRVDATHPWPERSLEAEDSGAEIVVAGPVVSPQQPEAAPVEERWPPEPRQHWDAPVAAELVTRLNRADVHAHLPDPGPPLVGPPLYGANHARQPRIETEEPAAGDQPSWFRQLNLDPRDRIVGGLGTRVVQAEQEDLMVAAWNQVLGVEAANRALRLAQLAKHVSASLHQRHLARLTDAAVLAVTERVHAKLLEAPARSVWAAIESSSLPASVTTGAFRRLTRIRGPLARVAVTAGGPRAAAVEALSVRDDRLTSDWVRTYTSPDGVAALSAAAKARITDDLLARIAPGVDRDTLFARWDADLAEGDPAAPLEPDRLAGAPVPDALELGPALASSLLSRLVRSAPAPEEVTEREPAIAAAAHATLMQVLVALAGQSGPRELDLPAGDVERLRIEPLGASDDPTRLRVGLAELRSWAAQALEQAQGPEPDLPFEDLRASAERLRERIDRSQRVPGERLLTGLQAIAGQLILDDPFGDIARDRLSVPALELVTKLDPALTVPARVSARLTTGSGRLPGWLRPGWFDDHRIEPVMAHPRFSDPMYEPLHRYDREWMVPGLGLIQRPDMATLLQTNNRFIEAYLVGLNHEMGRELLWREYPSDQRGTYFSSFWTRRPELRADLHEPLWQTGELGLHVDPALDGKLVFLVRGDLIRRYPGVVAHAVRQARDPNDPNGLKNDRGIPLFEAADEESPVRTLFHVHLPPNVLLVGFALERARVAAGADTWWFTLSENPTEPRFGLDASREPPGPPPSRDDLVWSDFGVAEDGFLDATLHPEIQFGDSRWGDSSAQVASLLFQLPARAAFLGTRMLDPEANA